MEKSSEEETEGKESSTEQEPLEGESSSDWVSDEDFEATEADIERAKNEEESDRRKRYRLNKVLGATLTTPDGELQRARLFVIDISASGFRATDHSPHTEEFYQIEIVLSKDLEPFRSKMRVVWSKELTVSGMFQMGCEFIETEPEEAAKLEAFIAAERKKLESATAPTKVNLGRPWTMIRH